MAAGYSARPQSAKLGIKAGTRLALDRAPAGWALTDPPADLQLVGTGESAEVIISFFTAAADLAGRLPVLAERTFPTGAIWVAWPRRAGGHTSDITDNIIREQALPLGLVDVKVAAMDEDWSALRLVWRVSNRDR